jgi:DNA-binding NtrC family response regulator
MEFLKVAPDKAFAVSILIIDDNDVWRKTAALSCKEIFENAENELNIVEAASIDEGLASLTRQQFHVVLLDKELVDSKNKSINGIDFISEILSLQPNVQLLMFTATEDPRDIVRALQLGASGYLLKKGKPGYEDYRRYQLQLAIKRAKLTLDRERLLKGQEKDFPDFVAQSTAMKRLYHQLEALSEVSKPVLILGATGLGKGAAAKQLHRLRAKYLLQTTRPFFNINIANLSGEMALSELFGHEPNSFTGSANKTKQGFFELANDGDIFLDEIGEASLELQARLLKVVEEREFQRVGGNKTLKTGARLIFATNRDLKQMIQTGQFREDLYMRISTFVVEMPALSERKEDIPELIKVFLARMNCERTSQPVQIEDIPTDLIDHLMRDNIAGNIRGLENDLSRAIVMTPKDKSGRPNLTSWKQALGISKKYAPQTQSPTCSVSLEQFLNLPTDFLKPGFPGLQTVKKLFEKKLLSEAARKFPTLKARAEALGVPVPNASIKYSNLRKDSKNESKNDSFQGGI